MCSAVIRSGSTEACQYGSNCRFSHDIDAFLAQKPADIPGQCPFLCINQPCPFGMACRFSSTHVQSTAASSKTTNKADTADGQLPPGETNGLQKDLQKLLWKEALPFTRAEAQLAALNLTGRGRGQRKEASAPNEDSAALPVATSAPVESAPPSADVDATCPPAETPGEGSADRGVDNTEGGVAVEEVDLPQAKRQKASEHGGGKEEVAVGTPGTGVGGETGPRYGGGAGAGLVGADEELRLPLRERKLVDFRGKLYLAPLTTVGNLPFRRVCKGLGADITCGEMAMATNLLQGQPSEWALLRRHESEKVFGVQLCGSHPDALARCADLITSKCDVDFVDINIGCPIDIVVNRGAGSCLLTKVGRLEQIVRATSGSIDTALTFKVRTGYYEGKNMAHTIFPVAREWGAQAVTIHGRTRQQRYSKLADWKYIAECASAAPKELQVIGNGDVFSYEDWNAHLANSGVATCMVARGALIKPWIFTEIKEQRHWDISGSERMDLLKDFANYGLLHWGSDPRGVETTRRFLLDWMSYLCRYIPVGLLDVAPAKMTWRPPAYFGRDDRETLLGSESASDWVRVTEMLLGPPPPGFSFTPKHKSNAYDNEQNG